MCFTNPFGLDLEIDPQRITGDCVTNYLHKDYLRQKIEAMAEEKSKKNQINIELPEEVAEGVYSNLAIISHSHSEFVVDFIRMIPNVPKAKVKARVIITPEHAKRFLKALADNVNKFEAQHGTIPEKGKAELPPMNFTPTAQA